MTHNEVVFKDLLLMCLSPSRLGEIHSPCTIAVNTFSLFRCIVIYLGQTPLHDTDFWKGVRLHVSSIDSPVGEKKIGHRRSDTGPVSSVG